MAEIAVDDLEVGMRVRVVDIFLGRAQRVGTITSIREEPTGGTTVTVDGTPYLVNRDDPRLSEAQFFPAPRPRAETPPPTPPPEFKLGESPLRRSRTAGRRKTNRRRRRTTRRNGARK